MSGNFVRKVLGAASVALSVGILAPSMAVAQDEPLKVGFVYVSPIGEAGWTWQQGIGPPSADERAGRQGPDAIRRRCA